MTMSRALKVALAAVREAGEIAGRMKMPDTPIPTPAGATPGPWTIDRRSATHVIAGERGVAHCGGTTRNDDGGEHIAENEANAHLIAAAPDLYAALEWLIADKCGQVPMVGSYADAIERAVSALARARGDAP